MQKTQYDQEGADNGMIIKCIHCKAEFESPANSGAGRYCPDHRGIFYQKTGAKSVSHLAAITRNDNWETPWKLYHQACKAYDIKPQLDVAADAENKKCELYFNEQTDALKQEWSMDFFCNPPYSKVAAFTQRASEMSFKHAVTGLVLTYAKTDTAWWHDYVEGKAEVHFIRGRVKFCHNGTESQNSAPYPSAWIIYWSKL